MTDKLITPKNKNSGSPNGEPEDNQLKLEQFFPRQESGEYYIEKIINNKTKQEYFLKYKDGNERKNVINKIIYTTNNLSLDYPDGLKLEDLSETEDDITLWYYSSDLFIAPEFEEEAAKEGLGVRWRVYERE